MRLEIQIRYTTGFDTVETVDAERDAIRAAKAYRRRGYYVRILHNGEPCQANPHAGMLYKTRRYVDGNGNRVKHSFGLGFEPKA